jgi:hypothetical protein
MAVKHTVKYIKSNKMVEEVRFLTRGKAIRLKCLDCSGGSSHEVERCLLTKCPLYPWRKGYEDAPPCFAEATTPPSA